MQSAPLVSRATGADSLAVRDVLTHMAARSVRIGNIWVPGSEVEQSLARFGKLLFCLNKSVEHPYTLRGSATGVRRGDKCKLFCCRHQYQGYDASDVVIALDKSAQTLISGSQLIWRTENPGNQGEDYLDVCAMTFVPENYQSPSLKQTFFHMIDADCWNGSRDANLFIFGYPTDLRNVDYEEPHISVRQIVTSAVVTGSSNSEGVHQIKMSRTKIFSSDGLSGGPVFHLGRDRAGFFIGLAGIVLRGSDTSEYLHMLDVRYLRQFFDRA